MPLMIVVGSSVMPPNLRVEGISVAVAATFSVPFALGSCAFFFADRIPMRGSLAAIAASAYVVSLPLGLYSYLGLIGLAYALLWLASSKLARSFDSRGDFSYGIYMYAFPVEQGLALMGVHDQPLFVAAGFSITLPLAMLSYLVIEKPALRLKRLNPRVRHRRPVGSEAASGDR
jgi:peptidoglycan/LPS O-acetylase OafA/YrhL